MPILQQKYHHKDTVRRQKQAKEMGYQIRLQRATAEAGPAPSGHAAELLRDA